MPKRALGERPATTLQTAQRALTFLEHVAQAPQPPRLKQVAAALGLNITTCYHLANTLQEAGYLVKDADGSLRIGGRAAVLYRGMLRHFVVGRDLHPLVAGLSARTQETAYLSTLSGEGVVIQVLVEGTKAVRVTGLYVGFSGAEHLRASGKAVLAHLPEDGRARLLASAMRGLPARERRAATARLQDELTVVRANGWALDERSFDETVCCVAAPFFQADGSVAGSLAVSMPAERFPASRDAAVASVVAAAAEVSRFLGYDRLAAPALVGG